MKNFAEMIATGEITVDELANAQGLIERAKLVKAGLNACRKTISFPLGLNQVNCYSYTDSAGEYEAWGKCTSEGIFTCYSNWGGMHEVDSCNLLDYKDVFLSFENQEFAHNLRRFLLQQIENVN